MTSAVQSSPDRQHAPPMLPVSGIKVQHAQVFHLDNGIKVHYVNAGFQELSRIEFIFDNRGFDPDHPMMPATASRMLQEGTRKHNALELAELIDNYGAFLESEESYDSCSLVLFTLNKHLSKTLPVVREQLTEAVFPENELSIYRKNQKQRLVVENERVNSVARRKFNNLLYGDNHPYGYFITPEDYDKVTSNDLRAYFPMHYHAGNCTILVAGIVTDETLQLLNKYFGSKDWLPAKEDSRDTGTIVSASGKVNYLHKDGALQSAIRIGRRMITRAHPDYPGVAVLNTVLGGYFGSRLMSNIREEKGYTYGIGSATVSLRHDGYFFISTEVGAKVTQSALDEIYKEMAILQEEMVEKEELSMVRNYLLGSFLKGIDGPFALIDRCKSLLLNGLDYTYYDRYISTIERIGPEEIRELARKYFNRSDLYELVVGVK